MISYNMLQSNYVWYYDKIRIEKLFDNFTIPDAVEDKVDYDVAKKEGTHMFMVHFNFWCDI